MSENVPSQTPSQTPSRNAPCHCGSGRKYKQCHLRADDDVRRAELRPSAWQTLLAFVVDFFTTPDVEIVHMSGRTMLKLHVEGETVLLKGEYMHDFNRAQPAERLKMLKDLRERIRQAKADRDTVSGR